MGWRVPIQMCQALIYDWKRRLCFITVRQTRESPFLEFPFGETSTWTPLRLLKELHSKLFLPCIALAEHGLFKLLCYINTKGSCHSLHSYSQPVICKFYSIWSLLFPMWSLLKLSQCFRRGNENLMSFKLRSHIRELIQVNEEKKSN